MSTPENTEKTLNIKELVADVLKTIEREREREIIARRFGLYDRKETLEQIGELLGITRERVRQLEKAVLIRLKITAEEGNEQVAQLEKYLIRHLHELGRTARTLDLAKHIDTKAGPREQAHIAFISEVAPKLALVNENDFYYQSVGIKEYGNEKQIKAKVDELVKAVKEHKKPLTIEELDEKLSYEHPDHVKAIAMVSKQITHLKDMWGLVKWPTVNPKNIRDKIFAVLSEENKPMHFSAIANAIKESDFKRKDVTMQAIHNELIKDKRFVLIGRGIYALSDWGYSRGTVSDIIADVLKKEGEPLHRDEIVKRVLKHRKVKETTILLNLQSKPQFKRTARATYTLAEEKAAA
ncbi:hypothetical protein KC939_02370 [Candidatus Saccharibacteria bacterium]|nr:hypothetical protein [Candidatus Saccharibacteria bacterium]